MTERQATAKFALSPEGILSRIRNSNGPFSNSSFSSFQLNKIAFVVSKNGFNFVYY